MTTEHNAMSRTRKAAIAAVLVAGLSGAITIVGVSTASSDPGSAPAVTADANHGSMEPGDPADCEKLAEENGMGDHQDMGDFADMMGEHFSDMMSGGSRMGA